MRATALSPAVAVVSYVRAPEPQFKVPPSSCAPNYKGIEGSVSTDSIEQDEDQARWYSWPLDLLRKPVIIAITITDVHHLAIRDVQKGVMYDTGIDD